MNQWNGVGIIERTPRVFHDADSASPRTTATLRLIESGTDGKAYATFIPLEAWGRSGEALAALAAGDIIAVTGKLCWRRHTVKGVERNGLSVLVSQVRQVAPADAATLVT